MPRRDTIEVVILTAGVVVLLDVWRYCFAATSHMIIMKVNITISEHIYILLPGLSIPQNDVKKKKGKIQECNEE